jgi:rhamnose utilization protein RhaD (predicted bifunctional aldolase and dehydrogenase)
VGGVGELTPEERNILIGWRDATKWLRDNIDALPAPCTRPDVLAFIDKHTAVDGNYHWPAIRQLVEQRDEWYRKYATAEAQLAVIQSLAMEHMSCSGCATPWWLKQALGADPDTADA